MPERQISDEHPEKANTLTSTWLPCVSAFRAVSVESGGCIFRSLFCVRSTDLINAVFTIGNAWIPATYIVVRCRLSCSRHNLFSFRSELGGFWTRDRSVLRLFCASSHDPTRVPSLFSRVAHISVLLGDGGGPCRPLPPLRQRVWTADALLVWHCARSGVR